MSERVSETIILCEDRPQARLVLAYMHCCGLRTKEPSVNPVIASEKAQGGNVHWVLREFPKQFNACRQRHKAKAKTLLIVVIDADDNTIDERCRQLDDALRHDGLELLSPSDPISVLIPKRHIETWIRAATTGSTNETDDYKALPPTKDQIRNAARRIFDWTRSAPQPEDPCVPSLLRALPQWRRIG